MWDASLLTEFELLDKGTASKCLLSTRVKELVNNVADVCVEIQLPREADAIKLLCDAAGVPYSSAPPEAAGVVRLAGRLPLVIGISGKILATGGLASDRAEWQRLTGLLESEIATGVSPTTAVIRTSLSEVRASEQERRSVRLLFKAMAMAPEDTIIPLEVIQIMYVSSARTNRLPTIAQVRRWLRRLIDRNLVLNSVDRPQLHDLVLDECQSQHTVQELKQAHFELVELLRRTRPALPNERRAWQITMHDDLVCKYVCNEVRFHIGEAVGGDDIDSGQLWYPWLLDYPQDAISFWTAHTITVQNIVERLEPRAAEQWEKVLLLYVAAQVETAMKGKLPGIVVYRAAARLFPVDPASVQAVTGSEVVLDEFELSLVLKLLSAYQEEDMAEFASSVQRLKATPAATSDPVTFVGVVMQTEMMPAFLVHGDWVKCCAVQMDVVRYMVAKLNSGDDCDRGLCLAFACVGVSFCVDISALILKRDWSIYGPGGNLIIEAFEEYNYDVHHMQLMNNVGYDNMALPMAGWSLAVVWGDMEACQSIHSIQLDIERKCLADTARSASAHTIHDMSYMWSLPLVTLGRPEAAESILREFGWTWEEIPSFCDLWGELDAGVRRQPLSPGYVRQPNYDPDSLGCESPVGFFDRDCWCWAMRCNWGLVSETVTAEMVAQVPAPKQILSMMMGWSEPLTKSCMQHAFGNTFLLAALLHEKFGQIERALEYIQFALEPDQRNGGDWGPARKCQSLMCNGRLLAAMAAKPSSVSAAKRAAAALAALELAVDVAQEHGLALLALLALRDLKVHCSEATAAAAGCRPLESRIGEVLLQMKGSSKSRAAQACAMGPGFDEATLARCMEQARADTPAPPRSLMLLVMENEMVKPTTKVAMQASSIAEVRAALKEELGLEQEIAMSKPAATREDAMSMLITDLAGVGDRDKVMVWPARGTLY
jgi:hypothetical protein